MRKTIALLGLVMASLSFASVAKNNDNNPYGDVTVIGNGTGSVSISQCASTWNCNNSELNVDFTGDVENVFINGEHTVIKGKDGINGTNGTNGIDGKDGAQGIQGEKGDKGDTGATGANGRDGKDGAPGAKGDTGAQGEKGDTGLAGKDGQNGLDGKNGVNGKDADMSLVNANTAANKATAARQESYEKSTNQRFADMGKRIDDNRNHASAGIAGVAAMANIPQVSQNSSFSVGAGVGSYDGEQGIAVGASARFNQNVVTKASVAGTTQSDFVFGAGVSYEW